MKAKKIECIKTKLCLGSSATATETMKNLILPGIGKCTIVDDHVVDNADLGQNFFLGEEDLGKSRAESVAGEYFFLS